MLLWGTANPKGLDDQYHGIYLSDKDIKSMVEQVESANRSRTYIPVHLEHKGVPVGRVVSAWEHDGTLQCVLQMDEKVLEGSIGSEFIRNGICNDLSLGYVVELKNSAAGDDENGDCIIGEAAGAGSGSSSSSSSSSSRGPGGRIKVSGKYLKEISVVRKGARQNCHIHAVTSRLPADGELGARGGTMIMDMLEGGF